MSGGGREERREGGEEGGRESGREGGRKGGKEGRRIEGGSQEEAGSRKSKEEEGEVGEIRKEGRKVR